MRMLVCIYLDHHLAVVAFGLLVQGDVLRLAFAEGVHFDWSGHYPDGFFIAFLFGLRVNTMWMVGSEQAHIMYMMGGWPGTST